MGESRLFLGQGGALALAFALLAAPALAWAHASLVKSVPAQRAALYRAPAKVQLWFNERLEPRYSSMTLVDGSGKPVELGTVAVADDDPKSLVAPLKALPPGRYAVRYRVLSTDGHVVQSEFAFTIRQ